MNYTKIRLATGLCPHLLGEGGYSAPLDSVAVIRGKEGLGKGRIWGRKRVERKDMKE